MAKSFEEIDFDDGEEVYLPHEIEQIENLNSSGKNTKNTSNNNKKKRKRKADESTFMDSGSKIVKKSKIKTDKKQSVQFEVKSSPSSIKSYRKTPKVSKTLATWEKGLTRQKLFDIDELNTSSEDVEGFLHEKKSAKNKKERKLQSNKKEDVFGWNESNLTGESLLNLNVVKTKSSLLKNKSHTAVKKVDKKEPLVNYQVIFTNGKFVNLRNVQHRMSLLQDDEEVLPFEQFDKSEEFSSDERLSFQEYFKRHGRGKYPSTKELNEFSPLKFEEFLASQEVETSEKLKTSREIEKSQNQIKLQLKLDLKDTNLKNTKSFESNEDNEDKEKEKDDKLEQYSTLATLGSSDDEQSDFGQTFNTSSTVLVDFNNVAENDKNNSISSWESDLENLQNEEDLEDLDKTQVEVKKTELTQGSTRKKIVLPAGKSIYIQGIASVELIAGKIEINGFNLLVNVKYELYSPRGTSHLYIKNTSKIVEATLIFEHLQSLKFDFIEKHIPQKLRPKSGFTLQDTDSLTSNILTIPDDWNISVPVKNSDGTFEKVIFCGGKSVGKSTFLRYFCNKLLNDYEKVVIVDLDPGQSEFTIPGCLSISVVKTPLFGPNYTHLKQPEKCVYLGEINVANDPVKYLTCVQTLVKSLETDPRFVGAPILINTMGFTRGLGFELMSAVLNVIQPGQVLEICSKSNKGRNYTGSLTYKAVGKHELLFKSFQQNNLKAYDLKKITACEGCTKGWVLVPRQVRELCVFAYFSQVLPVQDILTIGDDLTIGDSSSNGDVLSNQDVLSNGVSYGDVLSNGDVSSNMNVLSKETKKILSLTDRSIQLLEADLNILKELSYEHYLGNLVALCNSSGNSEIFDCSGFGIVKSVDLETETVAFITPVDCEELNVDRVLLSEVSLPPSFYMSEDENSGGFPFVQVGTLSESEFTQMSHRAYLGVSRE